MLTWVPNADYRAPGLLKDVVNAWPTPRGYKTAQSPNGENSLTTTIPDAGITVSGISAIRPDGTGTAVMAIDSSLLSFGTGSSLNRAGGYSQANFVFSATFKRIYATNGFDPLQFQDLATLGNFANVPKLCPIAKIVVHTNNQTILFNTTASITYGANTYPASGSRYHISAVGVDDDFFPSIATGAFTGELNDQDGEVVAAIELNGYIVAFKRSAVYVGEFVDLSFWAWRKAHSEFGCIGPLACTKSENKIYFFSSSNGGELCVFDGNQVQSLSRQALGPLQIFTKKSGFFDNDSGGEPVIIPGAPNVQYSRVSVASTNGLVYFSKASRKTSPLPIVYDSTIYVYEVSTGRFGKAIYSPTQANATTIYGMWNGFENSSIVYAGSLGGFYCGGVLKDTPGKTAKYTMYREGQKGARLSVGSGQAYFLEAIPSIGTASAKVTATYPADTASPNVSTNLLRGDGRFSGAQVSGQRIELELTIPDYHEIVDLEMDVSASGTNQTKSPGRLA